MRKKLIHAEDILMTRAVKCGYPQPKFKVGDIIISDCTIGIDTWKNTSYQMLPGDKVLVEGIIPILIPQGGFYTPSYEGPWWHCTFKNLSRGGDWFSMDGCPATQSVISRTKASEILYE